jgi:hypothetical protein
MHLYDLVHQGNVGFFSKEWIIWWKKFFFSFVRSGLMMTRIENAEWWQWVIDSCVVFLSALFFFLNSKYAHNYRTSLSSSFEKEQVYTTISILSTSSSFFFSLSRVHFIDIIIVSLFSSVVTIARLSFSLT